MQVDPIKPKLKPPGTKRWKLKRVILLSNFAFKFNLRRYSPDSGSHNDRGSVVASYSGVPPPPPMFTATPSAAPRVGSDETVMPTYGVALLAGAYTRPLFSST